MTVPVNLKLSCGCCFIIPPAVLRALSLGQKKVKTRNPKIFQDSFAETQRLRSIREGHRVASLIGRRSHTAEAVAHQPEEHLFDCRHRMTLPGRAVPNPTEAGQDFKTVFETTAGVAEFYKTVTGTQFRR